MQSGSYLIYFDKTWVSLAQMISIYKQLKIPCLICYVFFLSKQKNDSGEKKNRLDIKARIWYCF